MGIYVIGSGGHAKIVVQTFLDLKMDVDACVDEHPEPRQKSVIRVPIKGPVSVIPGRSRAFIAIGDNATRKKLAEERLDLVWVNALHPHSYHGQEVTMGTGNLLAAGTIVQPGTTIGSHCIINTGATVDHDCVLGDFVHVAPGAHIAGGVQIGEGAFIGVGASLVPGVKIGAWAVIAPGAVVTQDVPGR